MYFVVIERKKNIKKTKQTKYILKNIHVLRALNNGINRKT